MSSMYEWAKFYLSQGLPVFPVQGKTPLIKWGIYQERLPSEEEIKEWWTKWPNADIGMVTGPISGRLVLDIDGAEGVQSVSRYSFPVTTKVGTKRGYQNHYIWPVGSEFKTTLANIIPNKEDPKKSGGVDVRGEGGYVKLPPSSFSDNSGRYTWECEEPLVSAPQWLIDLLIENSKPRVVTSSDTSWLQEKLNGLTNGNRNQTFCSLAGSLRSRGWSSSDIFSLLDPHARRVGFELEELKKICDSVGTYTPRVANDKSESFSKFLEYEEKVQWIVPGIIARNSLGFVAGLPMTSKTWMLMDLAVVVAKGGGQWLGKFPVNPAKVMFIDQERFRGETQRRFKALMQGKGLSSAYLNDTLHVKCGSTIRLNVPASFDAFRHELSEYRPELVIVDSFATFHTAAENDRTEIQRVLERIKQLRTEFSCAFLFINHETKGVLHMEPGEEKKTPSMADMVGSIGVSAAAEEVLTVRRKDAETCVVYNTKNSLASAFAPFNVTVEDMDTEKTKIKVRAY